MLYSKEVLIPIVSSNMAHYISKGYIMPKIMNKYKKMITPRGTKILVKIKDLQLASEVQVECLCDFCKTNTIKRKYCEYIGTMNKPDYKDCCEECKDKKRNNHEKIGSRSKITKIIEKNYTIKYGINFDKEISIIDWWKFTYYGTPNGNILLQIPRTIINDDNNIKEICKYVLENELNYKNREDFLNLNGILLKKYKLAFHHNKNIGSSCINLLQFCYPEYRFKPYEMGHVKNDYYKDESIRFEAIDWYVTENKITLKDILSLDFKIDNTFLASLIKRYFKTRHKLWIWYFNKKGIKISENDFRIRSNNFWKSVENRNIALKDLILDKLKLTDLENDIPKYINGSYLKMGYEAFNLNCNKYYGNMNFYKWCSEVFPEYKDKWNEENFGKVYIAYDGTVCNSIPERIIYEFIKKTYNLNIKAIGMKRNTKYCFLPSEESIDNKYFPDFVIEDIIIDNKKKKLLRPLIIEYYGMFEENNKTERIIKYNEKTLRKEEYYKSNKDINYLGFFRKDLYYDMKGVKEKLTSFFMSKFNIDIDEINKKEDELYYGNTIF